jgi:hypothetical protein
MVSRMIARAVAVWFLILFLASLNGAIREAWLIPRFGPAVGRAVSTLVLCGVVYLVTWGTITWINPTTAGRALGVGVLWTGLTLAFEFLAGHYLLHQPWAMLLEDYDVTRGRIWPAVLVVVLLAPLWTARSRGLLTGTAS